MLKKNHPIIKRGTLYGTERDNRGGGDMVSGERGGKMNDYIGL